jgi:hypothetical protein
MTAAPLQIRAFRGFDKKGDIGAPKFVTVNPLQRAELVHHRAHRRRSHAGDPHAR